MQDDLMDVAELAALLKVPEGYVYRLNYERRGPKPIKLGFRKVRYRRSEVERWLAEREQMAGIVGE